MPSFMPRRFSSTSGVASEVTIDIEAVDDSDEDDFDLFNDIKEVFTEEESREMRIE